MKLKALADMSVPLLDRAHVSAGEIVDVPDDLNVIWSPEYWEPVRESKTASKKEG